MRARIHLTRVHQISGPDYWQADCYFKDYSFRTKGMTQQKALNKMFHELEKHSHYDWYMAHAMNNLYDLRKRREEDLARFSYVPSPVKPWDMVDVLVKTDRQVEEVQAKPEEPKGIFHWFKKLIK